MSRSALFRPPAIGSWRKIRRPPPGWCWISCGKSNTTIVVISPFCYKRDGWGVQEPVMKHAILFILLATPAFADTGSICIDASSRNQYNARPLALHDVLARNAFGSDHRAARITTTCIHIYRDSFV